MLYRKSSVYAQNFLKLGGNIPTVSNDLSNGIVVNLYILFSLTFVQWNPEREMGKMFFSVPPPTPISVALCIPERMNKKPRAC